MTGTEVNLYVDSLMTIQPTSGDAVLAAIDDNPLRFAKAAQQLGLSDREYHEFIRALVAGNERYVRLPRHYDGISGYSRRWGVYAISNVVISGRVGTGWVVRLSDGREIAVLATCGNLAVIKAEPIKAAKQFAQPRHKAISAVSYVPPPTPVVVTPPIAPMVAPAATIAPPAATGAEHHDGGLWWPFAVGAAALRWIDSGFTNGAAPAVAPCTSGQNTDIVCQK